MLKLLLSRLDYCYRPAVTLVPQHCDWGGFDEGAILSFTEIPEFWRKELENHHRKQMVESKYIIEVPFFNTYEEVINYALMLYSSDDEEKEIAEALCREFYFYISLAEVARRVYKIAEFRLREGYEKVGIHIHDYKEEIKNVG